MHMKTFDGGINMAILLSGRDLKKNFLEKEIIKNISFDIGIGDKIGIVGLNGTGKTTLANIMTGICKADDGKISQHKKSVTIGYLKQDLSYFKSDNSQNQYKDYLKTSKKLGLQKVKDWDGEKFSNISGGEETKLALSQIFSTTLDFLILDEPTNHLDYRGVQWLINEIKGYKGTLLVISHDRFFLNECANKILEIEDGTISEYKGNYDFYREEKKKRYDDELKKYLIQEDYKLKINNQISNLKNWSQKAHRESREKAIATGNKFGGKEYLRVKAKKKDIQIKSRIKRLEKIEAHGVKKPKEDNKINFNFQKGEIKGKRVLEANNISKSFNGKVLF